MQLKILLPTEILVDQEVIQVSAESDNGSLTLLPNTLDLITAIIPGILCFEHESKNKVCMAVNQGILVKCGEEIRISIERVIRLTGQNSFQPTVFVVEHQTQIGVD